MTAVSSNVQILVVEDERIVAKDITRSLERLGYGVTGIASSGEEAVRMVGDAPPDLILMDIVLKGDIDGIDAAEHIRRRLDVPVIYLTAYADSTTLERAKGTVPYGYLLKPWQERELRTVIEIALHKHTLEQRLKQTDAELHRVLETAAAEWRLTFDAIASPVLLVDHAGRILRLNTAAVRLAAKPYEACVGAPVTAFGQASPWSRIAEAVEAARGGGAAPPVQATDAASGRTWDITARGWTAPGEERRVIVVATDVTPLLELQASLRRSETMSAMGALVAGVAHEARNPLFGISANLDALEARAESAGDQRETIQHMRAALDRLTSLMQQLLDYGKPPALERGEGDVALVVAEAVDACQLLAERAGVRIVTHVEGQPVLPQVDRHRLVQLFENLVENAVQHTSAGGTVHVEVGPAREADQEWVVCRVRDQGPGFATTDLPKIFEPFFTRRRGGTGLGLSIVQRIVHEHGGQVEAANAPEGGAVMTVHLPAWTAPAGRDIQ